MKKYAVIEYHDPYTLYPIGLFDSYYAAAECVRARISEDKEYYKDDGNKFECTECDRLESEEGDYFEVSCKSASWAEAKTYYYYILSINDCEGMRGDEE